MKPWMTGPKELLEHATGHIRGETSFDLRIAFISIDNAVELCIKTYLGLPKRVRGSDGPARRRLQDAGYRFPDLLDLLEEFAPDKIADVDLGEVEWFHRLRNALYHEGNGITVDPEKADGYLQVARILFENLMGEPIQDQTLTLPTTDIGSFITQWSHLERNLRDLVEREIGNTGQRHAPPAMMIKLLEEKHAISADDVNTLTLVRIKRNELVHGVSTANPKELKEIISQLETVSKKIEIRLQMEN